jgi:hypothetical protein
MRYIPTTVHGILDYGSVGGLLALPRLMGWSTRVTQLLTGAALGTLLYSMLTRYELGLVKVLPMQGHLALDGMQGTLMCGAAALLREEDTVTRAGLVGIGMFELGASMMSKTE